MIISYFDGSNNIFADCIIGRFSPRGGRSFRGRSGRDGHDVDAAAPANDAYGAPANDAYGAPAYDDYGAGKNSKIYLFSIASI